MLADLHLIPFLLFTICLFCLITLYLSYRIRTPESFGRVLRFSLLYIFVNSLYTFIIEVYMPNYDWKERITPFAMLYGPLLFFGIIALRDRKLPLRTIFIHALPFIYVLIGFLLISFGFIDEGSQFRKSLHSQLTLACPCSFVIYTFSSFFAGRNLFTSEFRDKMMMFVFGRIALLFLAILFLIIGFSKTTANDDGAIYILRMVIYSCMFLFILMVFNFTVNKLLGRFPQTAKVEPRKKALEKFESPKYERSTLTESQLQEYQDRLISTMENEKLFLDISLSLSTLAYHLKLPNHHLTQVLSLKINQTFYQFVNTYRIEEACRLLRLPDFDITLEELAAHCGFNSKVSFNRQFKTIMGCTPSDYRQKLTTSTS